MQKQRNTIRKRMVYLAILGLIALTTTATSTYAWFDFYLLSGGTAIAIIVILGLIVGAIVYAKFFRGSATKLFSEIKGFRK